MLFQINHSLCKEYTVLSPYEIDEKPFFEVIELFGETRQMQIREKISSNPNRIIRRKAGDDWY